MGRPNLKSSLDHVQGFHLNNTFQTLNETPAAQSRSSVLSSARPLSATQTLAGRWSKHQSNPTNPTIQGVCPGVCTALLKEVGVPDNRKPLLCASFPVLLKYLALIMNFQRVIEKLLNASTGEI